MSIQYRLDGTLLTNRIAPRTKPESMRSTT
jgi:hypothetical protein